MNYGDKIAQLRKSRNWTQKDLGDRLNISPQAVSKWEKGISQPDIESLRKISTLFKISIDDLLGNEGTLENPERAQNKNETPKPVQEKEASAPVIGVCKGCGKTITTEVSHNILEKRMGRATVNELYCGDCFEKAMRQMNAEEEEKKKRAKLAQVENSKKILKRGFIWGAVAAVLALIVTLVVKAELYYIILFPIGMFTLVSQVIWGNWISDFFLFFCRSFKAPFGFIFELSLDGIFWLLTVKLALWIICGVLSILFFLIGLVLSMLLSFICSPFNIPIAIKAAKTGELEGFM